MDDIKEEEITKIRSGDNNTTEEKVCGSRVHVIYQVQIVFFKEKLAD